MAFYVGWLVLGLLGLVSARRVGLLELLTLAAPITMGAPGWLGALSFMAPLLSVLPGAVGQIWPYGINAEEVRLGNDSNGSGNNLSGLAVNAVSNAVNAASYGNAGNFDSGAYPEPSGFWISRSPPNMFNSYVPEEPIINIPWLQPGQHSMSMPLIGPVEGPGACLSPDGCGVTGYGVGGGFLP